jgi:hypothetical protein
MAIIDPANNHVSAKLKTPFKKLTPCNQGIKIISFTAPSNIALSKKFPKVPEKVKAIATINNLSCE